MGIREIIDRNKRWLVPVCFGTGAIGLAYSTWSTYHQNDLSGPVSRVYYSDDEGKSYFPDDLEKTFPFDHDGKQAYRAYVFQCDGIGKPFVGLIGRQVHETEGPSPSANSHFKSDARSDPIQVKKPGDDKWVPFFSPEGQKLIKSLCPSGDPEPVLP